MVNNIKKVAVIGAGTIGAGWATLFAVKGYDVNLYSRRAETRAKSIKTIESNLDFLAEKEMLSKDDVAQSFERIKEVAELPKAVKDVDYVQECVAEDYGIKKSIFAEADKFSPENTILASSSSGLKMTEIQQATSRPGKCIVAHPWNPPHLIPLVEIVPGEKTSDETIDVTLKLQTKLGKVAVVVKKEVPGYIGNRLAAALWREAIDLVERGVATVEDVDKALYAGPGIRWALMGTHLIYQLGGGKDGIGHFIDHLGRTTFKTIWEDMATWSYITDSTKTELIDGVKSEMGKREMDELVRWRDDKLIKLLKVIYNE
jgi:3-hydroxyacyl-CoA dehydrogenase